jgi:hypothetical protein
MCEGNYACGVAQVKCMANAGQVPEPEPEPLPEPEPELELELSGMSLWLTPESPGELTLKSKP